jgi:flagellar biosynthetic protein FliQ
MPMVADIGPDLALALMSHMMWTAAILLGPLIGITSAVGLVVSILQGVTQIQESSLTFVPKLIAAGAVLLALGGWMIGVVRDYATGLIASLPNYLQT